MTAVLQQFESRVARFPTEGSDEASYVDLSTPYEQAINEAERRRAAETQK